MDDYGHKPCFISGTPVHAWVNYQLIEMFLNDEKKRREEVKGIAEKSYFFIWTAQ